MDALTAISGREMRAEDISILYFLDSEDGMDLMSSEDYAIKRVVLASGTRKGWNRGQYYASNILAGPSKSYWPVKRILIKGTQLWLS